MQRGDGHLRHVLVPVAAARRLHVRPVRRVLQDRRFRVLGQQLGPELLSVRGRRRRRSATAAGVRAVFAATAVRLPGVLRLRQSDGAGADAVATDARALLWLAFQTKLVEPVEGRLFRVLVNDSV